MFSLHCLWSMTYPILYLLWSCWTTRTEMTDFLEKQLMEIRRSRLWDSSLLLDIYMGVFSFFFSPCASFGMWLYLPPITSLLRWCRWWWFSFLLSLLLHSRSRLALVNVVVDVMMIALSSPGNLLHLSELLRVCHVKSNFVHMRRLSEAMMFRVI